MNSRKFLITGATGLIGSALVRHLAKLCPDARLVLPVRNLAKAQAMLGDVAGAMLWRKHLSESGKHEEMIQASNTYHALLFMWLRLPRFTRFIDKILGKFIRKSHKKK